MGFQYTPDQEKVIKLHDRNLLVAAAAGSGKTAVLVERIVRMISDAERNVDIDRLLIVTFTKAAAAEMRERISSAINQRLEAEPENKHLQKQTALLHNAQITTIDSFCLFVIRNNFNDIGLDPDFRVADEGESRLLMQDAMAEMMEENFANGEESFYRLLEAYCPDGKEKKLEETILTLYRYAQSYPFPEQWLEQCKRAYEIPDAASLEQSSWVQYLMTHIHEMLSEQIGLLETALELAQGPYGPSAYAPLLQAEINDLITWNQAHSYEQMNRIAQQIAYATLPRKKEEGESDELRETVKAIRNAVKDSVKELIKKYFFQPPEQVVADLAISAELAGEFIRLTNSFSQVFAQKKREKKLVDFSDMEHLALQILVQEKDGEYVPTATAEDYQQYFEEVLIDEYQDSNLVQEFLLRAVSKEGTGENNRFMVGDVKQSIYRFRLARPEIFMEKYDTYTTSDSATQKIDLSMNFRSRQEVIDSVNFIFGQIMTKKLGNVAYDENAALYLGASYPTPPELQRGEMSSRAEGSMKNYDTELHLIETVRGDKENARIVEAKLIASRIHELVGSFPVTNRDGSQRPATYRDITILLRVTSGWDEVFKRVLEEEGIPAFVTSRTGYFATLEIQTLLNVIRVLNNPYQDIPLYGMMKSMFGDFTDEEIAQIRKEKKCRLYTSVKEAAGAAEQTEIQRKAVRFLEQIEHYRTLSVYTPIHELLLRLINDTGYYEYVSALPGGAQRRANVDMLVQRAVEFGNTSYRGLFHFIRYIEQLRKYEVDYGEALLADENADVVRIMSIHKSKGLEFPICFVAGVGKEFNLTDYYKPLLMDIDMGISTKVIDVEKRQYEESLYRNAMEVKGIMDAIGEELRVLYVALTRAKEKLIITGSMTGLAGKVEKASSVIGRQEAELPYSRLMSARSYLDLILFAIARHPGFELLLEHYDLERREGALTGLPITRIFMRVLQPEDISGKLMQQKVQKQLLKRQLLTDYGQLLAESGQLPKAVTAEYEELQSRIAFRYPHENLKNLYTKTTVSELKKAAMELLDTPDPDIKMFEEEKETSYVPSFIAEKQEVTGTKRGTAYHRILELLDLHNAQSEQLISSQLDRMVEEGEMPAEYRDIVQLTKLFGFAKSSLAQRMAEAEEQHRLFREQPFVLGLPANVVDPEFPAEETILIQGIIDVYFEEEDGLVLADYKTDRVNAPEDLVLRYQAQLDYYTKALEQLTGKRVKERIIYSLFFMQEIVL